MPLPPRRIFLARTRPRCRCRAEEGKPSRRNGVAKLRRAQASRVSAVGSFPKRTKADGAWGAGQEENTGTIPSSKVTTNTPPRRPAVGGVEGGRVRRGGNRTEPRYQTLRPRARSLPEYTAFASLWWEILVASVPLPDQCSGRANNKRKRAERQAMWRRPENGLQPPTNSGPPLPVGGLHKRQIPETSPRSCGHPTPSW